MRGGFEREVVAGLKRWGRAGVLGTLRPLSLIKAGRGRPTGEVWPHLALIRAAAWFQPGSALAHRPSQTDRPPHGSPSTAPGGRTGRPSSGHSGGGEASPPPLSLLRPWHALSFPPYSLPILEAHSSHLQWKSACTVRLQLRFISTCFWILGDIGAAQGA